MSRETIDRAVALYEAGDLEGATTLLDSLPPLDPNTDEEADRLELRGRIASGAEAVALLDQALALRVRLHGKKGEHAARGHGALANHYLYEGNFSAGLGAAKDAVRASDAVKWSTLLGDAQRMSGDAAAAEKTYLRLLKKLRGAARLDALRGLGNVHILQGNAARAKKRYREALALVDDDSFHAAQLYEGLGQAASAAGGHAEAVEHLERALAIFIATVGETHSEVAICLNNIGIAQSEDDNYGAAAAMQHAIAVGEHLYPDGHPHQATSLGNLAFLCSEVGKPAAALVYAERALAMQERLLDPWNLDIAITLSNMANYHHELGQNDLALGIATRLSAMAPRLAENEQETTAAILFSTGTILLKVGHDADRAAELYTLALAMREKLRESDDEVVLNTARNAAAQLFEAGAGDRAIALLEAAKLRWTDDDFLETLDYKLAALRVGDRLAVLEDSELEEGDDADDDEEDDDEDDDEDEDEDEDEDDDEEDEDDDDR